jgi:hypothetical protein
MDREIYLYTLNNTPLMCEGGRQSQHVNRKIRTYIREKRGTKVILGFLDTLWNQDSYTRHWEI